MADNPAFTAAEQALFEALLACCEHYLEWGCGTSTMIAASRVSGSITSIDSSRDWIARVRHTIKPPLPPMSRFVYADIGAVGAFGYPINESARDRWPDYSDPLRHSTRRPDLVLVDGRFRVACALRTFAAWNTLVLVHDYQRSHYAAIGEHGREIARAERLSLFIGYSDKVPAEYLHDPR